MTKWELCFVTVSPDEKVKVRLPEDEGKYPVYQVKSGNVEGILTAFAAEGWDIVTSYTMNDDVKFVLKKPK